MAPLKFIVTMAIALAVHVPDVVSLGIPTRPGSEARAAQDRAIARSEAKFKGHYSGCVLIPLFFILVLTTLIEFGVLLHLPHLLGRQGELIKRFLTVSIYYSLRSSFT